MSYILEALRRADAERARGAVPGLNTPAPEAVEDESPAAPRPWLWLVAGVVVALGVVLAWRWAGPTAAPEGPVLASVSAPAVPIDRSPAVQPVTAAPPAAEPAPAAPPTQGTAAASSEPSLAPSINRAPSSTSPALAASATAEPRADAPATVASRRAGVARESPTRKAAPTAAVASTTAPSVPRGDAAPRVYRQADLPEEIRRVLPRVSIGGSIYSENAASRMIVINGQVLHEGENLAADLSLRQIRLKEAVLEFRGYRFEVPY